MTIAVTGGTGFVGQCLLDLAEEQGIGVQALARKAQADRKGVSWYAGDLLNPKALNRLCRRTEAVIHVAGLTTATHPAEFEASNVAGTMAVIEAALKAANVRYERHLYPGTQHGFNNDTTPRFDAAAAKLAWERTLAHFNKHLR
jgi:nucleoside-diphosphate-sugar epimerase